MKNQKNRNSEKRRAFCVALGGIFTALGVVIMYAGSLIEVLDLTAAVIASLLCIVTVIDLGKRWAWVVYAATSVLATVLLPNKFPAVTYLLFVGYYPMIKAALEGRITSRGVRFAVKLLIFNPAFAAITAVSVFVLRIPFDERGFMIAVLFALGNLTFIIYDIALTRLITFYIVKLRPRLKFLDR